MPLSLPKGASKATILSFSYIKLDFAGRKCAAKFVCVKTVSGKVVRHSLAYPSVQKWLVAGDVPFYVKFWVKMTHPASTRSLAIAKRPCDCCIILKSGYYTKAI